MKDPLLAFVHIEKAAGTTLIYLLRRNYALRYLDVRPLRPASNGMFTAADLRPCLRINPFLRSIGGHAVKPFGDLELVAPDIRYITILRNPVHRYLSQYRYWVRVLRKDISFEAFLDHAPAHDFQTRKLVGAGTLAEAKRMLAERFFLVGVAERFDEFITQLAHRLRPKGFDTAYAPRNVADGSEAEPGPSPVFEDRIRANNARDVELYEYVVTELLPRQRSLYPSASPKAAAEHGADAEHAGGHIELVANAICRKLYYEPVTGILRRLRGMPMKGSY